MATTPTVNFHIGNHTYQFFYGLGAQLVSRELRTPAPGTTRTLDLQDGSPPLRIRVFSTLREGFKVRIGWAIPENADLETHHAAIRALRSRLQNLI